MRICVKRHKAVKGEEKGGERSRTDKRGNEQIREEQHASRSLTLYWLMLWLYFALCPCFSKLAWQALASTPGAACDLLGEAAAPQAGSRQHKATHKLA